MAKILMAVREEGSTGGTAKVKISRSRKMIS